MLTYIPLYYVYADQYHYTSEVGDQNVQEADDDARDEREHERHAEPIIPHREMYADLISTLLHVY